MLNEFAGFLPLKKGTGLLNQVRREGIAQLKGTAAECCLMKENADILPDYSFTMNTFPSPGFAKRAQSLWESLTEEGIETVSFLLEGRSYQMSGFAKGNEFLLLTDLPVSEKVLSAALRQCGERVLLGSEKGRISMASLYLGKEKLPITRIGLEKLVNCCYILLMNLSRREILKQGRLYEVGLLAFPNRELAFALGSELLKLGAFSRPESLLKAVFAHLPPELRSQVEISLLSDQQTLFLCRDDRLLPWEETLPKMFLGTHIRLMIKLGYGGENLCCWKALN